MTGLEGRVAIVTGAASGIGRATARLLTQHGAAVGLVDRSAEGLQAVADELARAEPAVVDLLDTAAIPGVVARIREALGPIDIVVNAAGAALGGPFENEDYEAIWDDAFRINVTSHVAVVRACLDDLVRNGDGRIVNIASVEGLAAARNTSPYTASKHAVVGLTRSLAVELGRRGVTANCVCPGPINTGMTAVIPDEHKAVFARRRVPIGRYGEPEEVAYMVAALVMPAASYVNGAVIPVDGGMTAMG